MAPGHADENEAGAIALVASRHRRRASSLHRIVQLFSNLTVLPGDGRLHHWWLTVREVVHRVRVHVVFAPNELGLFGRRLTVLTASLYAANGTAFGGFMRRDFMRLELGSVIEEDIARLARERSLVVLRDDGVYPFVLVQQRHVRVAHAAHVALEHASRELVYGVVIKWWRRVKRIARFVVSRHVRITIRGLLFLLLLLLLHLQSVHVVTEREIRGRVFVITFFLLDMCVHRLVGWLLRRLQVRIEHPGFVASRLFSSNALILITVLFCLSKSANEMSPLETILRKMKLGEFSVTKRYLKKLMNDHYIKLR